MISIVGILKVLIKESLTEPVSTNGEASYNTSLRL